MAKLPKTNTVTIRLQIPDVTIYVIRTNNPGLYYTEKLLKKYPKLPPMTGTCLALQSANLECYVDKTWIVVPHDCSTSTIVHEIVHTVDAIMNAFGFEGTEFRAYYVDYIISQLGN